MKKINILIKFITDLLLGIIVLFIIVYIFVTVLGSIATWSFYNLLSVIYNITPISEWDPALRIIIVMLLLPIILLICLGMGISIRRDIKEYKESRNKLDRTYTI